MKQPYRRVFVDYGWDWVPVELTGKCKKITGGPGSQEDYYVAQARFLGIAIYKYLVRKDDVKFFDPIVETIYECKCNEQ